ncbi:nuclease-related domain-containing protein [Siminovitchia fortis]|uniref:NERD domain-containing protein n=1 Tax=Siminovitchia fortis TaxID=254758 RepID=A0A443IKQ4_9BACI|nr:nuclease-related domain-containing protein [Siminovitchia fortis]RWR05132.1 NERD domain-containing protein [Siminovitchia fortis]WHY81793.1 nuclease-related domain-containing protein [Siminovitchia fortis]
MIIKPLHEPEWLCLIPRFQGEHAEKQHFENLVKGYEGELKFAGLLEEISDDWLILYDLRLEYRRTIFQIDALLISPKSLHLFEVKNFESDFYIDSGKWFTINGKEIRDPVLQLNRCEFLLRQLLHEYGFNIPIKGNVVFINPTFTLYQAPLDLPIILPTQLDRLVQQLNRSAKKPGIRDINLAEKLAGAHLKRSPYDHLPEYNDSELKKGIYCAACSSFSISLKSDQITIICGKCGKEEAADSAVIRTLKEFQLLFPEEKVTTNRVYYWCGEIFSKKTVRRVLGRNFVLKGGGGSAHYVDLRADLSNTGMRGK